MAYITAKHYRNVHKGKYVGEDLGELILRASGLIDYLTHNRIGSRFEGLTAFQKKAVKKACCLIVDHMAAAGTMPDADVASYWMQDMRINLRQRKMRPWEAAGCGMWAWLTLMQTGLMGGRL